MVTISLESTCLFNGRCKVPIMALFVICLLAFTAASYAQPMCSSRYHPTDHCRPQYKHKDRIFIGKVIEEHKVAERNFSHPKKVTVKVEMMIKGDPVEEIDLYIDGTCTESVYKGGRHIFTADHKEHENFSGLFSARWSYELESFTEKEIEDIIEKTKKILRDERLPGITGDVIKYHDVATGSYFGTSMNMKLGYDPKEAQPLSGINVKARSTSGQEYTAKTNANGHFSFDVPDGEYEVMAELPKGLEMAYEIGFMASKDSRKLIFVGNDWCSSGMRFVAQPIYVKNENK